MVYSPTGLERISGCLSERKLRYTEAIRLLIDTTTWLLCMHGHEIQLSVENSSIRTAGEVLGGGGLRLPETPYLYFQYCICWIRQLPSRSHFRRPASKWIFTLKVATELWPQQLAHVHTVAVLARFFLHKLLQWAQNCMLSSFDKILKPPQNRYHFSLR
jgi:hypothetical protein